MADPTTTIIIEEKPIKKEEVKEVKKEKPVEKEVEGKKFLNIPAVNKEDYADNSGVVPQSGLMSFDAYFEVLKGKNSKVLAHHKEAVRLFMKQFGKLEKTEQDFDKIMEKY